MKTGHSGKWFIGWSSRHSIQWLFQINGGLFFSVIIGQLIRIFSYQSYSESVFQLISQFWVSQSSVSGLVTYLAHRFWLKVCWSVLSQSLAIFLSASQSVSQSVSDSQWVSESVSQSFHLSIHQSAMSLSQSVHPSISQSLSKIINKSPFSCIISLFYTDIFICLWVWTCNSSEMVWERLPKHGWRHTSSLSWNETHWTTVDG